MMLTEWHQAIAESERFRRRYPWDCKAGECEYEGPATNEFGTFIECVLCGSRVYAKEA